MDVDLRDTRGRLTRLAIAAAVGLAITIVVMRYVVSGTPNSDPVGASTVGLLAIFVFVVTTALVSGLLARRR
jgi:CBS-domain-containing membrane protein